MRGGFSCDCIAISRRSMPYLTMFVGRLFPEKPQPLAIRSLRSKMSIFTDGTGVEVCVSVGSFREGDSMVITIAKVFALRALSDEKAVFSEKLGGLLDRSFKLTTSLVPL